MRWHWTAWCHRLLLGAKTSSKKSKHFLDLLCGVVLISTEHIGLGAFGVAKFVDVSLIGLSFK